MVGREALGGDPAQAVTASIFYHVIYAVTAVGLGVFALRSSCLSWQTLVHADTATTRNVRNS